MTSAVIEAKLCWIPANMGTLLHNCSEFQECFSQVISPSRLSPRTSCFPAVPPTHTRAPLLKSALLCLFPLLGAFWSAEDEVSAKSCQARQLTPLNVCAIEMNLFSEASGAQVCFSLFDDFQLLILFDINKETVNVESIIISRLARDLQGLL